MGLACCARDFLGALVAARAQFLEVSLSVLVAEFEVVIMGLVLVDSLGLSRVVIESDAKGVIDLISNYEQCLNEFGTYLNYVEPLSCNRDVSFVLSSGM